MTMFLLDLPNELLEVFIWHLIGRPWTTDVRDFLSLTATCRTLRQFAHDQRYWQTMAKRRDPTCEIPPENSNWLDYCRQIYWQRTIPGDRLNESVSRFDDGYFCTIQKITIWPNKIRVYIDERGDDSLGSIQDPTHSILIVTDKIISEFDRPHGIESNESQFSIADPRSQYLGYLDFPYSITSESIGKVVSFQYGSSGYGTANLFRIDSAFIEKYNPMGLSVTDEDCRINQSTLQ